MAKTKTTNNKTSFLTNPIFIGVTIVVIIIIGVVVFLLLGNGEPESIENNRQPNNVSQEGETSASESGSVKPDVLQYEGENPNELSELTGQVRYVQQSDGFLVASVMINQYLSENGTCTMTLTGRKTGQVYKTESIAEPDVTTSTCGLLKFALQNAVSDYYDIEIQVTGDGKKGIIKTEGVEI